GYRSHVVEAYLEQGAKVTYESMQSLNDAWNFETRRARVGKDAKIDWFTATIGSKFSKVEVSSSLDRQGASTNNCGLFLGKDSQKFDIYNSVIHKAPNTYSDMNNRGIVMDKSKSIYRGLIRIDENSSNCNGYQTQDTLILSDEAEADAVPNLEIYNNDVKCSHGATIGQIDDEKLFYLMSRGLSRQEAIHEIVQGFLGDMADKVKSDVLKARMQQELARRLG
ncbi:SufD family Fe-S cluster assembly protein, partial [Nanoarchaeota archaeon]